MKQHSALAEQLGLQLNQAGLVETERSQHGAGFTSVDGAFVAGDASNGSSPSIPSAVADGYEIGATVNAQLSSEAFEEQW